MSVETVPSQSFANTFPTWEGKRRILEHLRAQKDCIVSNDEVGGSEGFREKGISWPNSILTSTQRNNSTKRETAGTRKPLGIIFGEGNICFLPLKKVPCPTIGLLTYMLAILQHRFENFSVGLFSLAQRIGSIKQGSASPSLFLDQFLSPPTLTQPQNASQSPLTSALLPIVLTFLQAVRMLPPSMFHIHALPPALHPFHPQSHPSPALPSPRMLHAPECSLKVVGWCRDSYSTFLDTHWVVPLA